MSVRRFKTSLLTQRKQYGAVSGRTASVPVVSGGTTVDAAGYRVHTFSYTGSDQALTFGTAASVEVFAWGAAGGGANAEGYSDPGGPGGYATGILSVVTPTSFVVQVGGGGGLSTSSARPARAYPAGGLPSVRNTYVNGGGGGRSALFNSSVSAGTAVLIAGGGGGASGHGGGAPWAARGCTGGSGGGTTGQFGRSPYDPAEGQNQGTQSSAGAYSTSPNVGVLPGQLQGGDAGNGTTFEASGWNCAGGGGDGWYGGGSIVNLHQGGGGGSGYIGAGVSSGALESTTLVDSRYSTAINPPQTSNPFYQTGIGRGNVNAAGGHGLIVVRYLLTSTYTYD